MSRIRTVGGVLRQAVGFLEEEASEYIVEAMAATNAEDKAYFMGRARRMLQSAARLAFVEKHNDAPTTGQANAYVTMKLRHFGALPKLPPKDERWKRELAEYEASPDFCGAERRSPNDQKARRSDDYSSSGT